jgi:hypothetical protein
MRIITNREVYSYLDEDKNKEKKEKKGKQWFADQKGKLDKIDDSLLFKAGASTLGQYLQTKYGQPGYNVTRDQEGNISLGSVDGGNVPIFAETEQEKIEREKKEKRKKTIIAVSVVGGLILIGVVAYVIYRNRTKK